jgi:1-pyrroline-5-carboxylate dehydrogenase
MKRAALSTMIPSWATVNPITMGTTAEPYAVSNLVGGEWTKAEKVMTIPHPMNKDMYPIFTIPDTQVSELGPFLESLKMVPKSGVHNPLKNPERYVQYGEISRKVCLCIV